MGRIPCVARLNIFTRCLIIFLYLGFTRYNKIKANDPQLTSFKEFIWTTGPIEIRTF